METAILAIASNIEYSLRFIAQTITPLAYTLQVIKMLLRFLNHSMKRRLQAWISSKNFHLGSDMYHSKLKKFKTPPITLEEAEALDCGFQ